MTGQSTFNDISSSIIIRDVQDSDMIVVQEIYADEVLNGVSSWEEVPPDLQEMQERKNSIINSGYPYQVAEKDGIILGYSYASAYRARPGYRFTVENSIYLSKSARGLGIGTLLLEDLITRCTDRGFRQMIAVIGDSNNHQSIQFHRKMGFEKSGLLKSIGFKFGRWMDSVIMQKQLGSGDQTSP